MSKPSSKILALLFWVLWSSCFIYLGSKHVSWRDEYQSWLVSTRTETLPEFFEAVRYERHPPLHYLLQRGVYEIAPEYRDSEPVMKSVTYVFSILNVGLILFFFPISLLYRVLLCLGIGFVLEYGLISRTYAIGSFFLLGSAVFERKEKRNLAALFLSLASLTHLYFTVFVAALLALRFLPFQSLRDTFEKLKKDHLSIFVGFIVFASMLLQRPPLDSVFGGFPNPLHLNPGRLLKHLGWGLTGFDGFWGEFEWNATPKLIGLFAVLLLWLFWKNRKLSQFKAKEFLLVIFGPLMLMNVSYAPYTRHVLLLWIVLLYFVIRDEIRPPLFRTMIFFMCFASLRFMFDWQPWKEVPSFDFSGQKEIGETLGAQLKSPESILIVDNEDIYFPIMGSLGINVYSAKRDRIFKYTFFRKSEWKLTLTEWCAKGGVAKLKTQYKDVYLGLALEQTPPPECGSAAKVFDTKRRTVFDEKYSVFKM